MEFHIFAIHDKYALRTHPHIFDTEDEGKAISKARQYAETIKEGTTVGLFKQDSNGKAHAIIAWRKMPNGTLRREEPLYAVENQFRLTSMDFEHKIRS